MQTAICMHALIKVSRHHFAKLDLCIADITRLDGRRGVCPDNVRELY
jgi:hypothetical protein